MNSLAGAGGPVGFPVVVWGFIGEFGEGIGRGEDVEVIGRGEETVFGRCTGGRGTGGGGREYRTDSVVASQGVVPP